jgi:glyoxylase-like metal-dependent hydrolase (beta-lactamase superfamily II)
MPRPGLAPSLVAVLLSAAPLVAQDPDSVNFTRQRLADGIYLLQGAGGNIGVSAGKDGVFIIDDDYAPLTPKLKAAVAGVSSSPIRFVINTHKHGDHTGGNEVLGAEGAMIVAQENVRARMSVSQFYKEFNQTTPAAPVSARPIITFGESMTLYLNGDTVDILHAKAAHTDGDAIIRFRRANIIHMGDTFFNGFYPYIDVTSGGSMDGMIAAANQALAFCNDQTKIIPGHGPMGNKVQLIAFRDMLINVRVRIAKAKIDGMTAEQVLNANLLADLDSTWGKGFMTPAQFAATAYNAIPRP